MTESSTHKDIYMQLKAILDGCDTIIDALYFGNYYVEKYPHMKSMIISYVNGKNYKDTMDIKTKQVILSDVNKCSSRDDALTLISKISEKTSDDVFKKIIERLAHRKHYKKIETKKEINTNISKKCPHCQHIVNMPEATQYVICGYHNPIIGYDWNGCGRDWCFQCGKMLCKKWETDSLHLQMNRQHDEECCLKHAYTNGYKYPDNYCQCTNMNLLKSLFK